MRKWFGQLHGGQLLMILMPLYLIGFCVMWLGYTLFLLPSNKTFADLYKLPASDSLYQRALEHSAHAEGTLGFRFTGVGLLLWLLTLPMIWWWLSVRRRKDLPGL